MSRFFRVLSCLFGQPEFMAPAVDMKGKTVVITGPTKGGIGYETARAMAKFHANVILGARNRASAAEAIESISEEVTQSSVKASECDLSKTDSVAIFAESVKNLAPTGVDVLICNAGAQFSNLQKTDEQVEMTFAVCALGHHLLIHLLQPRRVVWVTGDIYVMSKGDPDPHLDYAGHQAYMKACLARMLLARELKSRSEANTIPMEIVCVHPGVINSGFSKLGGLAKSIAGMVLLSPGYGAQASILAATAPSANIQQDAPLPYYHNKRGWQVLPEDDIAMNAEAGRRLFVKCDEICGISRT